MPNISGAIVLRPTRIGFLVRPTQQQLDTVRRIMRLCTCLWGGPLNPIIPVCKVLPREWRQEHFRDVTAKGLADAYIRFFEPDVFVEAEAGLAAEAGITTGKKFRSERIYTLDKLVQAHDGRPAEFVIGQSTEDIYRRLYQQDFKFAPRGDRRVAMLSEASAFGDAVVGDFPQTKALARLRKSFVEVCAPEVLAESAEQCLELRRKGYFTPLQASLHELDITYPNRDDPTVYVFDPTKTVDLIDFWNLRQFRSQVLPINVHWLHQSTDTIRRYVTGNFRPLPGNRNGIMIDTTVEFGRSIEKATQEAFVTASLKDLPQGSFSWKSWYDPIWRRDWRHGGVQPRRVQVTSKEAHIDEVVDEKNPTLRFPPLAPDFARKYSLVQNHVRWVNVVKLSAPAWSTSRFAVTFPPNVKGEDFPALDYGSHTLSTREGIVLFRQYASDRAYMRILPQQDAVIGWLSTKGIKASTSNSGRNAEQVLRSSQGARGGLLFADAGTIKLLDKMARTIHRESDGTTALYPDRTASLSEWKEVLGRRSDRLFTRVELNDFIGRNVMRVGLAIPCPQCAKENWYSLDEVGYAVSCERCLSPFPFPQAALKFNESDWRFRITGPFSVPNFADGAYATVLTMRLFSATLHGGDAPLAFSTGLDLEYQSAKLEVDFAGWYSEGRKFWIDPYPEVVFGESKSFAADAFKERDVQRLKTLATAIPGSFVVFSMLKEALSADEKLRIRKFAEWGRAPQKNGEPRAMVIVLTGTELFADFHVGETWKKLGGRHAQAVKHPSVHIDELWTLADLTQQLYLDMPSFWEWKEKKWKERANRRKA